MIKTLSRVGMEETYINIIKAICMTNPLPASYSTGKNYKCSPKTGNKTGMSTFTSLVLEVLATAVRQEEIKGIPIRKKEVKLSLLQMT